ncbi:acetaldehyde dehydrogenase (acetylating) [Desulfitobacterium hafniense DCB-2]|uniref:Acetaldehyde dehydrogenase n=1 Tax=Desulfitobacterium hafniense (strain DSM 10664 / DCB-2) TaxID=272564 RepID=ACDH_DESHD|nr:acetaldehyde dehydrogenase (acetylating) [Desulfitobacterium hafniense]B8G186.1 RecName: Full=Acetaldehyde dehydrogenase; AltName: Full=Acetaldehyde dehydrogenase [acetylating] [Desulfitobacterium hafniense DCB-2]ACL19301.1 acetaldehyde dehydrogenase (acetylating) [Desulfitobacterium hafniense DCB-2]
MGKQRLNAAIIGPGNIGTDLMYKILRRSEYLELKLVAGIVAESEGLRLAREEGVATSAAGIQAILDRKDIDIVFDATTAHAHAQHAPLLKDAGIIAVDLTPAAVGPYVMPVVNLEEHIDAMNVNLITCGGQATIPIVYAISRVVPTAYAEIVATIASKSAGPGTRQNIDEFTLTTAKGIVDIGNAQKGKAIILLNPADPPMMMNNTIYALIDQVDPAIEQKITESVEEIIKEVQAFVPGYKLKIPPMFDGNKVTVMIEVEGSGDYLPQYSGNLDLETCAALAVAEKMAKHKLAAGAN